MTTLAPDRVIADLAARYPDVRPAKGGTAETGHDFTALDRLMPHPVHGRMGWVAIPSPIQNSHADLSGPVHAAFDKARIVAERRPGAASIPKET